ncbi:MAG TPA: helix-turn-helix transcriptional regulator [Bryobacteraceae bacterium]
MNPAETALRLVAPIYEAATDPAHWPDILHQFANEVGGTTTGFLVHDAPARLNNSVSAVINVDPSLKSEYDAYYHSVNLHARKISTTEFETVSSSQNYIAESELLQSEYYNDFLKRYELFHLLAGFVAGDAKQSISMYSFRSLRAGPFSNESFQLLQLLIPHFQNAAKLHSRLGAMHAGIESLNTLSAAVFAVNVEGQILHMNDSACRIVEANDGLTAPLAKIMTWSRGEHIELLAAIHNASRAAMGNGLKAEGTLSIHRPSGKRPYAVRVRPIRSSRLLGGTQTSGAVVFIVDPESADQVDPDVFIRSFGLTQAEAKVAIILMNGKSLEECAAELKISMNTARTHLKRTLSKTGTQRQAELVRLLLKSFGRLRS